jgi:guanyl-specific ribonuclease Sa
MVNSNNQNNQPLNVKLLTTVPAAMDADEGAKKLLEAIETLGVSLINNVNTIHNLTLQAALQIMNHKNTGPLNRLYEALQTAASTLRKTPIRVEAWKAYVIYHCGGNVMFSTDHNSFGNNRKKLTEGEERNWALQDMAETPFWEWAEAEKEYRPVTLASVRNAINSIVTNIDKGLDHADFGLESVEGEAANGLLVSARQIKSTLQSI